jgi:hypothetical protein
MENINVIINKNKDENEYIKLSLPEIKKLFDKKIYVLGVKIIKGLTQKFLQKLREYMT